VKADLETEEASQEPVEAEPENFWDGEHRPVKVVAERGPNGAREQA
jgi:hypothetical protein